MEDKKFSWVLKILCKCKISVPIVPTYIIIENHPAVFITSDQSSLKSHRTEYTTSRDLLFKILSDYQSNKRLLLNRHNLCRLITNREKLLLTEKALSDYIDQQLTKPILYIQLPGQSYDYTETHYMLRLEYTKKGYFSQLWRQAAEKASFFDSIIFEKVSDLANVLMATVEFRSKKRVMIIEIEYLETFEKTLMISFIKELKVADPLVCQHYLLKTPNDLKGLPIRSSSVSKFNKLAKGMHVSQKVCKSPTGEVCFMKGRIRNKASDLNHEIIIFPPEGYNINDSFKPPQSKSGKLPLKSSRIMINDSAMRTKLEAKRARALRDELMKSPELRSQFGLNGKVGVLGVQLELPSNRSLSESGHKDTPKSTQNSRRPSGRIIMKEIMSPKSSKNTPRRAFKK